ncbi:MAG: helix-turn-helix domain-containing protein [Nitrospirae bacterium]|nr:helix-turn-helix domain-containing protein [Nitrospirota bacterium]
MAGEILKIKREESGKDIREISNLLKIKSEYLRAIENDEFAKLPIEVYAKGYIREYARLYKIDAEPIIKAYTEKMSLPEKEREEISLPANTTKKKMKINYLVYGVIIVVAALVPMIFVTPKSENRESTPTTKPMPAVQPVQQTENPVQESKIEDKKKQETKKHILKISASDTVWLQVNIDNTQTREMILKKGESATLSASENFSLKIGNAGGIKLTLDKKDIEVKGKKGQVISLVLPADKQRKTDTDKKN